MDNSELGLAANSAGVFLFFSVWPVLPNENQGGRPGLGRLYNRRDLAPTSHGILKTHYFSKLYVPPASPLGDPHLKSGSAGIWVTRPCRLDTFPGQTPRFSEIAKSTNLHGRIKDATIPKTPNFNEFRNFRNAGRAICVSKVPCRNMTFRFGRHQPGRPNSENSEIVPISEFSEFTWPQHRRHDSENSEI